MFTLSLSKKALAVVLSVLLCLPIASISAFADPEEGDSGTTNAIIDPEAPINDDLTSEDDQDETDLDIGAADIESEIEDEDSELNDAIEDYLEVDLSDAHKTSAVEVVEYVYLDEAAVVLGEEEYVAVGLLDEEAQISQAELSVMNLHTYEVMRFESSEIADNAALFSLLFEDDSEIGTYQVIGFSYALVGEDNATYADFSSDGEITNTYIFNVTTQQVIDAVEILDADESSDDSILAIEDTGEVSIVDTLDEAIEVIDEEGILETEETDFENDDEGIYYYGDEPIAGAVFDDEEDLEDELIESDETIYFDNEVYSTSADTDIFGKTFYTESIVGYEWALLANALEEQKSYSDGVIEEETDENESFVDKIFGFFASLFTVEKAYADVVVALDAGHGGSDPGAVGNNLKEKDLTLKIAKYAQSELNQYKGASVYMTRTTDTYLGLTERVTKAKNNKANVFVSIHINAGGGTGAEVWVPNSSSYNYSTHTKGTSLGNNILAQLKSLGLTNRGVKTRDATTEKYSGGGKADYYTVINAARKAGIPGIIVEHAFIDTTSDANYLKSEANLKKLGVADAAGIAKTYGLAKGKIIYQVHSETYGWGNTVGDGSTGGTTGKNKRAEAIKISLGNVTQTGSVTYSAHVQNIGWQSWQSNGALAGTTGQSKRMEAIKIKLSGNVANSYDIYYRVHSQIFGWSGWAKNGNPAGSQGYNRRMEAIQVRLVAKNGSAPGTTSNAFRQKTATNIQVQSYVQNSGWQSAVKNGSTSGTIGKSKAIQQLKITLTDRVDEGGLQFRAHSQGAGWQAWKYNGGTAGSSGKRMEAVQIKLTGDIANKYDVYYRAHCQYQGWLGWAKNGESAGTEGYSYRLEALQVKLVKKGASAPGSTSNAFKKKSTTAVTSGTAIMGTSKTSVNQMVKMWNAQKKQYPAIYSNYGAKDITTFCNIIMEEAKAEGVRAEVVFVQAMHETGWLQFNGVVKVSQCNFCGLGATSNTNPGYSFANVRTGIRAQVQHLKAYASKDSLKNTCVDPRWEDAVKTYGRGSAPNIEDLTGKWAADSKYAKGLVELLEKLLKL